MDFKPSIFIGSSKEGLDIAKALKEKLSEIAQVSIWPDVFDLNRSYFENLVSQIAFYDYAILVATADDTIISRRKKSKGARDNVIFEFGLFTGGLGSSRSFLVTEEGTKIPSDLAGISLPAIPKRESTYFDDSLDEVFVRINTHIVNKEKTFDLGFLPSSALAYGYFSNFVERTVERLLEDKANGKEFTLEDKSTFRIQTLRFTILIPNDLHDDMFKKVKAKRLKDGWQKLKVDPKDVRDYDFSVDVTKATLGELHLVDIPFTLNALNKAIELYSFKSHIGKSTKETLLEYREIRNFKRTLDYLIQTSAIAKGIVSIEVVNI